MTFHKLIDNILLRLV